MTAQSYLSPSGPGKVPPSPASDAMTESWFAKLPLPEPRPSDSGGRHSHRRLRVFMPADSPHINLCKTIMSSLALGYPPPILLNWGSEFNRPDWHLAGSHIAKLESWLAAIEDLLDNNHGDGDASDDDLALLVDAYDIWFQLPPNVLIQRFHQLNREADERVRRQWQAASTTAANFPISPPRQSILVTSAKDCHPKSDSGSDAHYPHWPQSPVRHDLYGQDTDQILPMFHGPAQRYRKVRPRCVNSGLIIGTMGALRHALQRCRDKIERVSRNGRQLWSDQALIGEVIGEQEMWREWARQLAAEWNGTASELDPSSLSREVREVAEAWMRGDQFEFGIGLDYNFTTIPPTCSAEEDGFFVRIDDREELRRESVKAGVPGEVRVSGIPPELLQSEGSSSGGALSDVVWGQVALYTDFYFGTTPVGIHHNAYVNNLKAWRLENWWNLTWFYPRLRELVTTQLLPPGPGQSLRPLARVAKGASRELELMYWWSATDRDRPRAKVYKPSSRRGAGATLMPIDWDSACQKGTRPWYDELFGDGKGPFTDVIDDESRSTPSRRAEKTLLGRHVKL